MTNWIDRPPNKKFPWTIVLICIGAAVILMTLGWILQRGRSLPPPVKSFSPAAVILSTGTIGMEGSLSESLGRSGVLPFESSQVERALKPLFNLRYSKAQDRYEIVRSTTGHFLQMKYWPNAFEYFTVTRSTSGVFAAQAGKIQLVESTVGVSGQIQGSLWEAMIAQGTPPEMIYRFAELFGWRIDFLTEPRKGDTYKLVWKRHAGNGAIKDDNILCALYQGKESGDVYAFPLAGDYYDAAGNSLRGEFLRAPLAFRRISSRFSERRFHPILRYYRPHHGIDYSAARGTPAVSIGEGVVMGRGYEKGLGNAVRVRHAGSYVSIYGHLMGYAKGIRVGGHVKQGQVVGYVGSSGLSTGPHLHFGFERGGQLINFLSLKMRNTQKNVPIPEREHFAEIKRRADSLFNQLTQHGGPLQTLHENS